MPTRTRPLAIDGLVGDEGLTDEQWEAVERLVAPFWRPGEMGRPATVDRRAVVDAVFHVAHTGISWRALPDHYPSWNTVHRLFLRWQRDGTWDEVLAALSSNA